MQHVAGVPVAPLALHPERGGPKKLPIAKAYLSDIEDHDAEGLVRKPHLVIVGAGWGVSLLTYCEPSWKVTDISHLLLLFQSVGLLQSLRPGDYHVTVISTDTYNTFTPLLPCMYSSRSTF